MYFLVLGGFYEGAFAFPLMVFAEDRLVFFQLAFEFAESLSTAAAGIFRGAGGVQGAGGQGQIHGKGVFFFVRILRESAVELD